MTCRARSDAIHWTKKRLSDYRSSRPVDAERPQRVDHRVRHGRHGGHDRKQVRRGDAQHRIANRGNDARQYSRIRRVGDISRVATRYQYLQDRIGAAVKRCGADDENPQPTPPLD